MNFDEWWENHNEVGHEGYYPGIEEAIARHAWKAAIKAAAERLDSYHKTTNDHNYWQCAAHIIRGIK